MKKYMALTIPILALSMLGGWIDGYDSGGYQAVRAGEAIGDSLLVVVTNELYEDGLSIWFLDLNGEVEKYHFVDHDLNVRGVVANDTMILIYGSFDDQPAILSLDLEGDTLFSRVLEDFPGEGEFNHLYLDSAGSVVGVATRRIPTGSTVFLFQDETWSQIGETSISWAFTGVRNYVGGMSGEINQIWKIGSDGVEVVWSYDPAAVMAVAIHQNHLVIGCYDHDDDTGFFRAVDTIDGSEIWTQDLPSHRRIEGIESCDSTLAICWNAYGSDIDSSAVLVINGQGVVLETQPIDLYRTSARCMASVADHYYVLLAMNRDLGVGYVDSDSFYYRRTHYVPEEVIDESKELPKGISLKAYPNPFNSAVSLELPNDTESIEISDISGRIIHRHSDLDGRQKVIWQPEQHISSGVYLTRTIGTGDSNTAKIIYIR